MNVQMLQGQIAEFQQSKINLNAQLNEALKKQSEIDELQGEISRIKAQNQKLPQILQEKEEYKKQYETQQMLVQQLQIQIQK